MTNQKGQTIIILILIMTVSLAIGLSIVQKSLVDVSTSTKVEETSRAFSAAEAGIEKALSGDTSTQTFTDSGAQILNISDSGQIPTIPASGPQDALEYPPLSKEEVTQVWLGDLNAVPPTAYYTQPSLDVYWGNSTSDKAGLELSLVYWDGSQYNVRKWFLDQPTKRDSSFDQAVCRQGGYDIVTTVTNNYTCKVSLGTNAGTTPDPAFAKAGYGVLPSGLMLLRARLLYNIGSQPFAVQASWPALGCSGNGCYLPPQARKITSTGVSGETQRKIQVFQLSKEVPPYFDFAIFSVGEISK